MADSKLLRITSACMITWGIILGGSGCATQAPPLGGEPPEIPPASTLVMEFAGFNDEGAAKTAVEGRDPRTAQFIDNGNWGWAAIHVGVWSVLLTVGLAVPVAAFVESFNHEPVQLEDGTWVWTYDVMVSGINHSAELHALAVNGEIQWDMYVTKEGFYENFNWFSGTSNLVGTAGTWTLNNSPNDPQLLLEIEWSRTPATDTADIRYTNIIPDDPENGAYIYYGTTDGEMDVFYDIYSASEGRMINVEWSRTTREGRVKDPNHFGDDQWRCWNTEQRDTDCSS